MGARAADRRLGFRVLGPLEVTRGTAPVATGGVRPRSILALLLLEPGRVVSADRLISATWGEAAPADPLATLQVHVSNLRRALSDPDAPSAPTPLLTRTPGYRIDVGPDDLDLLRFEDLVRRAAAAAAADRLPEAIDSYTRALGEWRGPAVADVAGGLPPDATQWLDQRRLAAVEDRLDLLLRTGRHREAVPDLETAVADAPLRERLWALLMVALYRSGRQADALGAFARARRTLRDELGLDPGTELRDLEAAVLAQDARLDLPATPEEPTAAIRVAGRPLHGTTTMPRPPGGPDALVLELPDGSLVPVGTEIVVIGRLDDVDVFLPGRDVSRRHAEVRPTVVGPLLVDLGSTNGTVVAGAPVVHHLLTAGDEIEIGSHLVRVRQETGRPEPGSIPQDGRVSWP